MPRMVRIVGATLESTPPPRSAPKRFCASNEDQRHGIGRVRGVRLAGLLVEHQLRVAVIGRDQRDAVHAFRRRRECDRPRCRCRARPPPPRPSRRCGRPCPGLAMFMMMTSYFFESIASTTLSVSSNTDISGFRSYVATFGDGTSMRSSPSNCVSEPPLKKNVTCAYFSVSAMRSCVRPACDEHFAEVVADRAPADRAPADRTSRDSGSSSRAAPSDARRARTA